MRGQSRAVVCGVADERGAYLLFQRALEPRAGDAGVHLEYSDEINGGYRCIHRCKLTRAQLSVDLSRRLGDPAGVKRIFSDQPDVLIAPALPGA